MERALARTYDPERWLRRWAFGIGALLLAGFFLPIYDPLWAEGWTWPWERTLSLLSKLDVFTPPVVGLVTIVAALTKSASLRLWLLIAAFTLVAVFAAEWVFTPFAGVRGARVVLQIGLLTSALFIAAANHLRRRHPDRGEFRRILLPIGILVAGLSLLQKYFEPTSRAQPEAAAGVLRWADHLQSSITGYVVAYGVLTAAHARADGRVVFRSRLLAWLTRAFFPFQALVARSLVRSPAPRSFDRPKRPAAVGPWGGSPQTLGSLGPARPLCAGLGGLGGKARDRPQGPERDPRGVTTRPPRAM
jgi:hypothetical protein